jgi:putative aldouronate transport system substrate-binding protein
MGGKKSLLFASDDLPDLFIGAGFTAKELLRYGKQGQLIAMNDLIDKYAPNIKEAFAAIPDAKAMSTLSDGNIYSLPLINQLPRDMHLRYWISTTWLKNVGKEVPKTLEEYYDVLVAFKEQDANGNGDPNDEIPLSGIDGYGVDGLILNALGVNSNGRNKNEITATADGKVFCLNISEEYKEYLKFMNKLYSEKLLDNDVFVQTKEQFEAKGHANLLGSFHSSASYLTCGSEIGYDYTQFDALTSARNSRKMVTASTGISTGVSAITSVNKYPEATIRLLDYCFSEQGSTVARNGEEGVGWRWVDKEKGIWENLQPEGYDGTQQWRAMVTAISAIPTWLRVEYQLGLGTRDAFWLNDMTDKFSYPYFVMRYPALDFTEEETEKMVPIENDLISYMDEARARFILGKDDIDKTWDSYVETVKKMGIQTIIDIHQAAYDKYLEAMK